MNKRFVIVVDAQNDFMRPDGLLSVPGAEPVIENINAMLKELHPGDVEGVLFTFDTHTQPEYDHSEEGKMFPPHCIHGTRGWELAVMPALINADIKTYSLKKSVFDMWQEPVLAIRDSMETEHDRDYFFQNLKDTGVTRVTVVGVCSDVCVEQAMKGLVERGFEVEVVAACVRGIRDQIETVVSERLPSVRIV